MSFPLSVFVCVSPSDRYRATIRACEMETVINISARLSLLYCWLEGMISRIISWCHRSTCQLLCLSVCSSHTILESRTSATSWQQYHVKVISALWFPSCWFVYWQIWIVSPTAQCHPTVQILDSVLGSYCFKANADTVWNKGHRGWYL